MTANAQVEIDYTNRRGERRLRRIVPRYWSFGRTKWYPNSCWTVFALDVEKNENRTFALSNIHGWKESGASS